MNLEETKKKETIRISKKDLLKLLSENEHMTNQITELQTRMTELVEENRRLKLEQITGRKAEPVIPEPMPFIRPDIYFDGGSGLDR